MPIYNLIECSSNYSEITGILGVYSKDEATDFNANIDYDNNFKSFKYKAKLSGNTVAQPNPNQANRILRNAKFAVPLKYLNNFCRSLEMPLINCNVELKLKYTKYCVLSAAGNGNVINDNNNANNITFTIKDTKLNVPVVTLSARDNQKLSQLLSKQFEILVYWNEYKTKSENKNMTNEYRYFLESNFVRVNRLFIFVHSNQDADPKRFKTKNIIYQKT